MLPNRHKSLLAQIRDIVEYLIQKVGKVSQEELDKEKKKYSFNDDLVKLFEVLIEKYKSTVKTKEELLKWIIRRVFKMKKNKSKKGKFNIFPDDLSDCENDEDSQM